MKATDRWYERGPDIKFKSIIEARCYVVDLPINVNGGGAQRICYR